jgi:hypothetical protein
VILLVKVLVKALGVKLLDVISTGITVFSVTLCISAEYGIRSQQEDKLRGCGNLYRLGWD